MNSRELVEGIRSGRRAVLGRAITLMESMRPDHVREARAALEELLSSTGKSKRIAFSGTPGVGKSSLIEVLGLNLCEQGKRVAVLAIDPSSTRTGGSILGDKTRMQNLSMHPNSFIRPAPNGTTLGGVARKTKESLLFCEAFGHDYTLVETVGVGQSEVAARDMVDLFVLLVQTGGGDDLQGIKRGILEVCDLVLITKADGDNVHRAESKRVEVSQALHILRGSSAPPVLCVSAHEGSGVIEAIEKIDELHAELDLNQRRIDQETRWMWELIRDQLITDFKAHPEVKNELPIVLDSVRRGDMSSHHAVDKLIELFVGNES